MTDKDEAPAVRYSVIVPAFNCETTLGDCLAGLVNQTAPRALYEVIVVDDGSTDGTAEVAARFPWTVLRQAHAGPASARNLGAQKARGAILLFTDADCWPTPNWIEEIVRPLESDPTAVASKGIYATRQTGIVPLFAQVELEEKYAALRRCSQIDFVDTYCAAFRADAFWAGGGFDPSFPLPSNEDTLLSFNLAMQGRRMVFTDRAIVYHRHAESLGSYLLRKWRHGYWRVPVFRRHPGKMAGDSYTPRSLQVQLLAVGLIILLAPWPALCLAWLGALGVFAAATAPFVRRALPAGVAVAVATPLILFLRATALLTGLAAGLAAMVVHRALGDIEAPSSLGP